MRKTYRKESSVFLFFVMAVLLISSATTPVMAADWGTLKAGDEMTWQDNIHNRLTKVKILEVGDELKLEMSFNNGEPFETTASGLLLSPFILPQSGYEGDPKEDYEWQGTTYRAYYEKTDQGDGTYTEAWADVNTGVLFKGQKVYADGTTTVWYELLSCTADLAEASGGGGGGGGCLGTLFIALFSLTTVISFAVVKRFKQKLN